MKPQTQNQRSARTARRAAIIGAILLIGGAAWASYVVKGHIAWYVLLPAAFAAACHYFGCQIFVRHFKALDDADDPSA